MLPTAIAIAYFTYSAADRYVSEARFIVRSAQRSNGGPNLSSLAASAPGEQRVSDDAYLVNAFLLSRDAVALLAEKEGLREAYGRAPSDILMNFPSVWQKGTDEELYRRFLDFTDARFDTASGISTLSVQAFRPEEARRLAVALLGGAEQLVNRLNERASRDAIQTAERNVELAVKRADEALDRLTQFRNRESITDPLRLSSGVFEVVGRLTLERAQTRAQLAEMTQASPGNVQITGLRNRLLALDEEIMRERRVLAGGDASLAPRIATYERLVLHRDFADRAHTSALQSLDAARSDAQKQRLYLERIVEPNVADEPRYPYRVLWTLLIFALSLAGALTLRVLVSNARQHGRL